MKKIKLKTKQLTATDIIKETPEQRKERIKYSKCMLTKTVESKKTYNRQKQKERDRKFYP